MSIPPDLLNLFHKHFPSELLFKPDWVHLQMLAYGVRNEHDDAAAPYMSDASNAASNLHESIIDNAATLIDKVKSTNIVTLPLDNVHAVLHPLCSGGSQLLDVATIARYVWYGCTYYKAEESRLSPPDEPCTVLRLPKDEDGYMRAVNSAMCFGAGISIVLGYMRLVANNIPHQAEMRGVVFDRMQETLNGLKGLTNINATSFKAAIVGIRRRELTTKEVESIDSWLVVHPGREDILTAQQQAALMSANLGGGNVN